MNDAKKWWKKTDGERLEISSRKQNIKETCQPKMGTIKDRNGKDLIEAEEIKESKNTQRNCTKKILMTLITTVVWSFT